ncbi:MAG: hypothetical protein HYX41_01255 [Bdellovibrio sp.]|nr:hypothetical protein [Bdellovibrio sp.]
MKKICAVVILVLASACGKQNPSKQELSSVTSGLVLTVRNALPEQQMGSDRVKPVLTAFFCSPMPSGDGPISTEDRCMRLSGQIKNGEEQNYIISRDELAKVFSRGNGKGSFEFADDQQITSKSWHCYTPNDEVTLDSNFDARQSWYVTVNQRFTWSYGCIVDRK